MASTFVVPKCLNDVLREVMDVSAQSDMPRSDILLNTLRKYHFWPALQMKKFFNRSGLVLLHNTYKRTDVSSFQELYDECRSVVLDLNAPEGQHLVISLANSTPERFTVDQYKEGRMTDTDKCELSYEGTVVFVYEHNGRWYFGTSGCPTVDSSRYFHPTITHGQMLDEVLRKYLSLSTDSEESPRDVLTEKLDATKSYSFILVHHHNRHIMDYTAELGESYGELFHIGTRDRATLAEEDIAASHPLADIGFRYTVSYETPAEAIEAIENNGDASYGIIVKTVDKKMYKVSTSSILQREEFDIGNPNKWHNMLHVYMQNNPEFHISDYIAKYAPDLTIPKNSSGRDMAPTYIIHTVICTMRDILYDLYVRTTTYNPVIGRFKMNKDLDASLPPVLRFHLAQLRHLQVNDHAGHFMTPRAVYQYLCFNQTMKNMKTLINFFASTGGHNMNFRQAECFGVLNQLLS
jgi:hypothetical protein